MLGSRLDELWLVQMKPSIGGELKGLASSFIVVFIEIVALRLGCSGTCWNSYADYEMFHLCSMDSKSNANSESEAESDTFKYILSVMDRIFSASRPYHFLAFLILSGRFNRSRPVAPQSLVHPNSEFDTALALASSAAAASASLLRSIKEGWPDMLFHGLFNPENNFPSSPMKRFYCVYVFIIHTPTGKPRPISLLDFETSTSAKCIESP